MLNDTAAFWAAIMAGELASEPGTCTYAHVHSCPSHSQPASRFYSLPARMQAPTCSCGVPRWRRSSSAATSSMDTAVATSPCFLLSCSATAMWARAVESATSRARGSRRWTASHSSPAAE